VGGSGSPRRTVRQGLCARLDAHTGRAKLRPADQPRETSCRCFRPNPSQRD